MSKSTPLSQLPSANQPPRFVSDQQRQFITQAQQAIGNSHMPQNTQASSDIANDDDIVVQDILNQINATTSSNEQSQQEPQMQQSQYSEQINVNPLLIQQLAAAQGPPPPQYPQQFMGPPQLMGGNIPPHILYQLTGGGGFPQDMPIQQTNGVIDYRTFMFYFADDLKLAALVFIVTVIVHFIPLEKFIGRYITIDKIPYHQVLFRAIMAAIIVVILKKLAKI